MPHQSVEVVRAGRAGVDLVIRDFGLLAQITAERLRDARRLLQRSSVRHVNDDLEFALVVEGQHLYPHPLQGNERNRRQQQHHHAAKEHPAATRHRESAGSSRGDTAAWSSLPLRACLARAPRSRSCAASAVPPRAKPQRPRSAKTTSPPMRPPESAACTGPSGRARRPWAGWRR